MTDKKRMRIEYAPGCFDTFEGTQEELNAFVDQLKTLNESGIFNDQPDELIDEDSNSDNSAQQEINK